MEIRVCDDSMQFVKLKDILDGRQVTALHRKMFDRVVWDVSQQQQHMCEQVDKHATSAVLLHPCPMALLVAAALYHEENSVSCCIATAFICRSLHWLTPTQMSVLQCAFPEEARDGLLETLF